MILSSVVCNLVSSYILQFTLISPVPDILQEAGSTSTGGSSVKRNLTHSFDEAVRESGRRASEDEGTRGGHVNGIPAAGGTYTGTWGRTWMMRLAGYSASPGSSCVSYSFRNLQSVFTQKYRSTICSPCCHPLGLGLQLYGIPGCNT